MKTIDKHYGHLAKDSEDAIRARLEARAARLGVKASEPGHRLAADGAKPCRQQVNRETGATGLEPATSGVTGRRSNQLNYAPAGRTV
jgi:hypothetical protein